MMLTEISAAVTALKTATELARSLLSSSRDNAVREKVLELQSVIFDLQQGLLGLQSTVASLQEENAQLQQEARRLKDEIACRKDWEETERRYKLTELGPGAYAYLYQREGGDETPAHKLCAKCFSNHKKSILQKSGHMLLSCHDCGSTIISPGDADPPTPPVIPIDRGRGY